MQPCNSVGAYCRVQYYYAGRVPNPFYYPINASINEYVYRPMQGLLPLLPGSGGGGFSCCFIQDLKRLIFQISGASNRYRYWYM